MFRETAPCFKMASSLLTQPVLLKELRLLTAHAGVNNLQARRHFGVGRCLKAKVPPARRARERVDIPGLEMISYGERMHYVPGLSKPVFSDWERDYKDPRHYMSPPTHKMPLFKEEPCYVFSQRTGMLEGVRQALWLTKTKLIAGLPPQLISLAEDPTNQIPDQDERVQNAIKHARFWDTTEDRPDKQKYSTTLLMNLMHLCATLQCSHPVTGKRVLAEKYSLAATWKRGEGLFQIRGQNGLLQNCMDPLPEVSGKEEVASTADHVLETLCPVSPTIDLQKVNVYREEVNCSGFTDDYRYPHAHTLYFLEEADARYKLPPEQFRASMIMFTFGNALVRAYKLYGVRIRKQQVPTDNCQYTYQMYLSLSSLRCMFVCQNQPQRVLDRPVTVQAVGTNGRLFQFLVLQLNSTDLSKDDGVKNQVWLDEDAKLYDFAKVRPMIKKKQVKVPAGLAGYKPETFRKFLALYLHGAV